MVTIEQWTNGVLTSILLRVGSSGGGLPDALQLFGFAGRRYFATAMHDFWCELPTWIASSSYPTQILIVPAHAGPCETFSTSAHLIHSKCTSRMSGLSVPGC